MMDVNKYNLPHEYRYGELVIKDEIAAKIISGEVDYETANRVVDAVVFIVDEAVLRFCYGY